MTDKWPDDYPDPEEFKPKKAASWPRFPSLLKPAQRRRALFVVLLTAMVLMLGVIIGQAISFYTLSRYKPRAVLIPANNPAPPTPINFVTPLPTSYPTPTPPPGPSPTPAAPLAGMVYRAEGDLWLVERGKQPQEVAGHPLAVLAPDGKSFAFQANGEVYLAQSGGGDAVNISSSDRRECCIWWWPANPDYLLTRFWDAGNADKPGVAVLSKTGEVVLMDENEYRYDFPAPSPDGKSVAYSRNGRPVLHHLSGNLETLDLPALGLPRYAVVTYPGWSADGSRMVWLATNESLQYSEIDILVIDLVQQQGRVLHTFSGTLQNGWLRAPAWSPDGQWLAYYDQGTWIISPDGSQRHYFGEGYFPVWDPDGRYLVLNRRQGPVLLTVPGGYAIELALPEGSSVLEWRTAE